MSILLGAVLAGSLCACAESSTTTTAAAPATSAGSPSFDARSVPCPKRKWPQPIPTAAIGNGVGYSMVGELDCFNVTQAVAPDGHDVLDDDLSVSRKFIIVKITPDVGTMVGMDDEVVLTVDTHMPGSGPT
ncbi:hypothetical protein ACFVVX_24365 [Kitasatospora sp. NPDC058170]|uniref:hypothetical protein n=1 Tax=Kitasatospora sp. NPDC058170 TaxID=3346364 RepID=UPI0036D7C4FC